MKINSIKAEFYDKKDCNNFRGISLINVGLKIISKIVTNRIAKYALEHKFVRPEQFGFRNKEECISLCQRRKFQGKFLLILLFSILKKAYDSVPIFNILTKLYNFGIRDKCHLFLKNLYLSSKARAFFNGNLSEEFSIVVLNKDALYLLFYSICSLKIY